MKRELAIPEGPGCCTVDELEAITLYASHSLASSGAWSCILSRAAQSWPIYTPSALLCSTLVLLTHLICRYCAFHSYDSADVLCPAGHLDDAWVDLELVPDLSWLLGFGARPSFAWLMIPLVSVVYPTLWLDFIVYKISLLQSPQKVNVLLRYHLGQTKPAAYKEVPTVCGFLCSPTIHVCTQRSCWKTDEGSV